LHWLEAVWKRVEKMIGNCILAALEVGQDPVAVDADDVELVAGMDAYRVVLLQLVEEAEAGAEAAIEVVAKEVVEDFDDGLQSAAAREDPAADEAVEEGRDSVQRRDYAQHKQAFAADGTVAAVECVEGVRLGVALE